MPHYKKKFDAANVRPGDLKSLADLPRFPFTAKLDLRDNYPFGMFAVPREDLLRLHASSGTTGKPTLVGYTKGDLDTWASLMARCLACMGAGPGDIAHNASGYGLFTGGLGAHYGGDRMRKAEEVTHHIKSMIGVTSRVVLKAPGEVPRSQDKAVQVVDRRNKAT